MEIPPSPTAIYPYATVVVLLIFFAIFVCGYGMHRLICMCQRLSDTIRTMGLAASNPVLAAKLEQQRLRQEPPSGKPGPSRAAILDEIARHQGAKARERFAQNRAAHPTPAKPTTMRYIAPDDDLLPQKKPLHHPWDHPAIGPTPNDGDKPEHAPVGRPQ